MVLLQEDAGQVAALDADGRGQVGDADLVHVVVVQIAEGDLGVGLAGVDALQGGLGILALDHAAEKAEQLSGSEEFVRECHFLCVHHAEDDGHQRVGILNAEDGVLFRETDFAEQFGDPVAAEAHPAVFPGIAPVRDVGRCDLREDQEHLPGRDRQGLPLVIVGAGSADNDMDQVGCADKGPRLVTRTALLVSAVVDVVGRGPPVVVLDIRHQIRREACAGNIGE